VHKTGLKRQGRGKPEDFARGSSGRRSRRHASLVAPKRGKRKVEWGSNLKEGEWQSSKSRQGYGPGTATA